MPRTAAHTDQQILDTCTALAAQGRPVTNQAVKDALGGGTFSRIAPLVKQYKSNGQAAMPNTDAADSDDHSTETVPDALAGAVMSALAGVIKQVKAEAQRSVLLEAQKSSLAIEAYRRDLARMTAENASMEQTIIEQEEIIEKMVLEAEKARKKAERAKRVSAPKQQKAEKTGGS